MIQENINTTRNKLKGKIFNQRVLLLQYQLRKSLYIIEERPFEDIRWIDRTINILKENIKNLEANLVILTL